MEFLEGTKVGRVPNRVFLAGGPDVGGRDLEEIVLWAPGEEGAGTPLGSILFLGLFLGLSFVSYFREVFWGEGVGEAPL